MISTFKFLWYSGWTSLLMLVLLLGGCREKEPSVPAAEVPRNVRVLKMAPGQLVEFFEISGPVAPVRGTNLSTQEAGQVVKLKVDKGQKVRQGQSILELERGILKAERDAAVAGLEAQTYNLDQVRKLNQAGKVSRLELLNSESAFKQAQSRATVSRQRYERAVIKAPFAGVVVERFVELGELVQPGQPVVRLIDPSVLKIVAYLTDQEVPWVKVGSTAEVELAGKKTTVFGKVTWVGLEADRMTGKFKMELEIDNPQGLLRSGVIGRARIQKNLLSGVLAIPRDAVLNSRNGNSVFVVEKDRAVLRNVTLGADQGNLVTVDKGLEPGERLVVRGHRSLRDGSLVKVTETATRNDGLLESDPAELRNVSSVGTNRTAEEASR